MSHPQNILYLEAIRERFDEIHEGFSRATIIRELKENGFDTEAESLVETWYDERKIYLDSIGVREEDIILDENGMEDYLDEREMGTPGDDYQIETIRCSVPSYLNVDYWLQEVKVKNKHD